jgi:hypothetical protein
MRNIISRSKEVRSKCIYKRIYEKGKKEAKKRVQFFLYILRGFPSFVKQWATAIKRVDRLEFLTEVTRKSAV